MLMKIGIIGTGLIGGSLALHLKNNRFAETLLGFDQNQEHLNSAISLNIIDKAYGFEELIKNSDLLIIAIPVDASQKLLPKILDQISENQTVMDVGSTKVGILKELENHPNRKRFVATHPMWGTEYSGPQAATLDSFSGRAVVLCDIENSSPDAVSLVEKLYNSINMSLLYMDSASHDIHTAYISHISHITSYALANTVLEKEKEEDTIFSLASSGFSSTVRLAKSEPEMWVPIFRQNKENVLDVLNEHISQLRKFKSALEKENYEYLSELIINANKIKRILK